MLKLRLTRLGDKILNFLKNGAQPTRTVKSILVKAGVWAKFEESKKK